MCSSKTATWLDPEDHGDGHDDAGAWLNAPTDDLAVLLAQSLKSARTGGRALVSGEAAECQVVVEDRRETMQAFAGRRSASIARRAPMLVFRRPGLTRCSPGRLAGRPPGTRFRATKSPPHYLQFAARVSSLLLGTEAPWEKDPLRGLAPHEEDLRRVPQNVTAGKRHSTSRQRRFKARSLGLSQRVRFPGRLAARFSRGRGGGRRGQGGCRGCTPARWVRTRHSAPAPDGGESLAAPEAATASRPTPDRRPNSTGAGRAAARPVLCVRALYQRAAALVGGAPVAGRSTAPRPA
jgi:hypothetical protein